MQKMNNKKGVKLLTAVMVMAMVFVGGFTIIGDSSESDAATDPITIGDNIMALEGDLIIVGEANLSTTLVIPDTKNVIIRNGGILDLAGNDLTVEGTLIVEAGGIITDSGSGSIILARGGTIDNSGSIGYEDQSVTVTASITGKNYLGVGSVTMKNVSGVNFGIVATGDSTDSNTDDVVEPVYSLTVTGDISSTAFDVYTSTVTITGARIIGDMTVGQDISLTTAADDSLGTATPALTYNTNVMPKAVLTIDGVLETTTNTLVMKNNSTVIVNGEVKEAIVAETGKFVANATEVPEISTVNLYAGPNYYVTGITLEVGQISYVDPSDSNKYIEQRLSIFGATDSVKKALGTGDSDGIISITNTTSTVKGLSIIPTGEKLVLDEGVTFTTTGVDTAVHGQITYPYKNGTAAVTGFVGAEYIVVDAADATKKTGYIMPFADAIKNIASAQNTTITVSGDVTIEEGFTLADKQKVNFEDSATTIISDKATVELQKGSSVTYIDTVKGVLKVYTGATGIPTNYDVIKKTTEYNEYSGLNIALKNAKAGDEITIRSGAAVDVEDDLVVAEGVKLISEADINAKKNVTVETGAELVLKSSTLTMVNDANKDYTLNVKGTLDASEGTMTISDTGAEIYSTGMMIVKTTQFTFNAQVNGFAYKDEEFNTVLTTLSNAILNASAQDINNDEVTAYGKVTETDDITVEKMTLSIAAGAEITLGNVKLVDAKIDAHTGATGKYTATVSGLNGIGDAAAEGTVKVSGYTNDLEQTKTMDGTGADVQTFSVLKVVDNVTVTDGTVTLKAAGAVGANSTLTINEGATLVTASGSTPEFSVGTAKLVINGTFKVLGNEITISDMVDDKLTIAGTLEIVEGKVTVSVTAVSITGSVICSTEDGKEGEFVINGAKVTVGKKITSLGATASVSGAVKLNATTDYLVSYAGADLSAAVFNETAGESTHVTTKFLVNGVDYATAYALDTNTVALTTAVPLSGVNIDGYTTGDKWLDATGKDAGSKYVGDIDSVDNKLSPKPAKIIYSVGNGISLWVDGVKVNSSTAAVDILLGVHDVVAKVNPGYKGDTTITFNGQTVTDGKIVITADMTKTGASSVILSATGDITFDTGSTEPVEKDDSGMGITDYLLIVLVVLAAILVVIVAIRMMRS